MSSGTSFVCRCFFARLRGERDVLVSMLGKQFANAFRLLVVLSSSLCHTACGHLCSLHSALPSFDA